MARRLRVLSLLTLLALVVVSAVGGTAASAGGADRLSRINHIVVIYQENHSFDNLYGRWEGVNGVRNAPRAGLPAQHGPDCGPRGEASPAPGGPQRPAMGCGPRRHRA